MSCSDYTVLPYLKKTQIVRHPFLLKVSYETEMRLRTTCFPRRGEKRAGMFEHCYSSQFLITMDRSMECGLIKEIQSIIDEDIKEECHGIDFTATWSCTVTFPKPVGWASTVPLCDLPAGIELDPFQPNKHTEAFVVPLNVVKAPRTDLVTFVFDLFRRDDGVYDVSILSLYPGYDVPLGTLEELRVIPPEEAVFLHWENIAEEDSVADPAAAP